MPKDWDEMDPYERMKESKKYGEQYGIDRGQFQEADRGSEGNFDQKGYEEAISRAANNHYDTRRAIEAAKMSGYEGADDLAKGISNMEELSKSFGFLENYHKDELGGNKFSSRNDFGNVTNSFVNRDRDNFTQKMEDSFASYSDQNDQQTEQPTTEIPDDSFEDTVAYKDFQKLQNQRGEFDVFGQQSRPDQVTTGGDADEQRQKAALEFADDYKLDLVKGLNLKPTIS